MAPSHGSSGKLVNPSGRLCQWVEPRCVGWAPRAIVFQSAISFWFISLCHTHSAQFLFFSLSCCSGWWVFCAGEVEFFFSVDQQGVWPLQWYFTVSSFLRSQISDREITASEKVLPLYKRKNCFPVASVLILQSFCTFDENLDAL